MQFNVKRGGYNGHQNLGEKNCQQFPYEVQFNVRIRGCCQQFRILKNLVGQSDQKEASNLDGPMENNADQQH